MKTIEKNSKLQTYYVVVNSEEQYSIWLSDKEIPLGWKKTDKKGSKSECLNYIKEVWVDMTPLSLRKKMKKNHPKLN